MSIDIKASRAICDAATPGPLSIQEPFAEHVSVVAGDDPANWIFIADFPYGVEGEYEQAQPYEKALACARQYIHARTALPAALDEIERLRTALKDVVWSMDCNHQPDDGGDECDGEDCVRCACDIALAGGEG